MKKNRNKRVHVIRSIAGITLIVAVSAAFLMPSSVAVTITQGTESKYGVLAGSEVTNTGTTTISGTSGSDVGVSTGSAIGLGISIGTGVLHSNDADAIAAQTALVATYTTLAAATSVPVADELGGLTLTAGVYKAPASLGLTGVLTLDAANVSSAVFILQSPSTLVTAANSSVVLTNGAQACNVYWQVSSSATLAANSTFVGRLYASTSITAQTGASIRGQLLAHTGAVTLDSNTIINDNCATVVTSTPPVINYPVAVEPVISQDSSITSVSGAVCSTTSAYVINLEGVFPTAVTNIAVNGTNIVPTRWIQSPNLIAIQIPASDTKSFSIQVYNGRTPMLSAQTFVCTDAAVIRDDTPTVTLEDVPTETGGLLPDTATDNYNYLAIGAGLALLGFAGLLRRKPIKN